MSPLDRLQWLAAVNRHPGMTPAGRAVAIALAVRAREGECYPGVRRFALDCGMTERGARGGVETLEKAGFLTVDRRAVGERADRKTNLYRLHDRNHHSPREDETTGTAVHPVDPHDRNRRSCRTRK